MEIWGNIFVQLKDWFVKSLNNCAIAEKNLKILSFLKNNINLSNNFEIFIKAICIIYQEFNLNTIC
jgi:hypothetical protein